MTETVLDIAYMAMESRPEDDKARLTFYERLADCELFLLLEKDAERDQIEPRLFETEEMRLVLAFDREHRLTEFAEGPAPYAALSGRNLASMLEGQDIHRAEAQHGHRLCRCAEPAVLQGKHADVLWRCQGLDRQAVAYH